VAVCSVPCRAAAGVEGPGAVRGIMKGHLNSAHSFPPKANPAKDGDAKPWVYRRLPHVRVDYDSRLPGFCRVLVRKEQPAALAYAEQQAFL